MGQCNLQIKHCTASIPVASDKRRAGNRQRTLTGLPRGTWPREVLRPEVGVPALLPNSKTQYHQTCWLCSFLRLTQMPTRDSSPHLGWAQPLIPEKVWRAPAKLFLETTHTPFFENCQLGGACCCRPFSPITVPHLMGGTTYELLGTG